MNIILQLFEIKLAIFYKNNIIITNIFVWHEITIIIDYLKPEIIFAQFFRVSQVKHKKGIIIK